MQYTAMNTLTVVVKKGVFLSVGLQISSYSFSWFSGIRVENYKAVGVLGEI